MRYRTVPKSLPGKLVLQLLWLMTDISLQTVRHIERDPRPVPLLWIIRTYLATLLSSEASVLIGYPRLTLASSQFIGSNSKLCMCQLDTAYLSLEVNFRIAEVHKQQVNQSSL